MLQPGAPIPPLVARDAHGAPVSLEAWHGKRLLLYFYPKDDTPGCTMEACAFRDNWALIQERGAEVVGVSPDPVVSHEAFARKYSLPFTLLSDADGAIAQAFGTAIEQQWAGKTFQSVARTTFLIDEAGVIRKVWGQVDPRTHVQEVVEALDALSETLPTAPQPAGPVEQDQVMAVLDTLRPFMQADGGDVELVGIDDGVVKLRLHGACGTCPSSTITLKMGLEAQLKQRVPGIKAVEAVL